MDLRNWKWREAGVDFIMKRFITCALQKILWRSNQGGEIGGMCVL